MLANSDMYFDSTLHYLHFAEMTAKFYALSRYDVLTNGSIRFNDWLARLSQDVWIFESPIPIDGM